MGLNSHSSFSKLETAGLMSNLPCYYAAWLPTNLRSIASHVTFDTWTGKNKEDR